MPVVTIPKSFFKDPKKLALKDADVQDLGYCIAFEGHMMSYSNFLVHFLSFARQLGGKGVDQFRHDVWQFNGPPAQINDKCDAKTSIAKPANTKKDDAKKPADTKKDDAKKNRVLQARHYLNWDLNKTFGKNKLSAMDSWEAYIEMPQRPVPKIDNPIFTKECINSSWNKFFNPLIFGKADEQIPTLPFANALFKTLAYLNDNIANETSNKVYNDMMGQQF